MKKKLELAVTSWDHKEIEAMQKVIDSKTIQWGMCQDFENFLQINNKDAVW